MTITKSAPPPAFVVDTAAIAELLAALVIGHIRERCEAGLDIHDKPFAKYSDSYQRTLQKLGRSTSPVDMLLSGGMLGSVKVVERDDNGVVIGLGTGTSRVVRPPPQKRRRQKKAKKLGRSPAHNLLGQWHQDGAGDNPAREWFGVSPRGDAAIRRQMVKRKPPLKAR
jgi:hypothetical protein